MACSERFELPTLGIEISKERYSYATGWCGPQTANSISSKNQPNREAGMPYSLSNVFDWHGLEPWQIVRTVIGGI